MHHISHPTWLNASVVKLALTQSLQGLAGVMFSMGLVFTNTQNNDAAGLALTLLTPALCPHLSARLLAVLWLTVLVRNVFL